jgi:hypothetical protein
MTKYPKTKKAWITHLKQHNVDLLDWIDSENLLTTLLTIQCQQCGAIEENILATNLYRRKQACRTCSDKKDYTTEGIRQLIMEHGGIYLSGKITHKNSSIRMICPGCHREVVKVAHDVSRRPDSCRLCRIERANKTVLTENDNLTRAHKVAKERRGQCLTEKGLVKTGDKLLWQCSLGHTWESTLASVDSQGSWCPICSSSRSENTIRILLEKAFEEPFIRTRPEFLDGLELDCYNAAMGLAIEVNGIQHYKQNHQFHRSAADLKRQMQNDRKKRQLCDQANIKLIVVPYFILDEGIDTTRQYLSRQLSQHGHTPVNDLCTVKINPWEIYDKQQDHDFLRFEQKVMKRNGSFDPNDYTGITKKISVTCKQGHTWLARPYIVIKGHWCPECAGNKTKTIAEIQAQLAKHGWALENPENLIYRNAKQKLPMICHCGSHITQSWNKWDRKQHNLSPGQQVSCQHCRRINNINAFVAKMKTLGVRMEIDNDSIFNNDLEITGTCLHCGDSMTLKKKQWLALTHPICCNEQNDLRQDQSCVAL